MAFVILQLRRLSCGLCLVWFSLKNSEDHCLRARRHHLTVSPEKEFHDNHGCCSPSFWPFAPQKISCPAATVAFVPHPHLPRVILLLFCNFVFCLTSVIIVFRSNSAEKARSENHFSPGMAHFTLLYMTLLNSS